MKNTYKLNYKKEYNYPKPKFIYKRRFKIVCNS